MFNAAVTFTNDFIGAVRTDAVVRARAAFSSQSSQSQQSSSGGCGFAGYHKSFSKV